MAGLLHSRFRILLAATVAAVVAAFLLPGTGIDRFAFAASVRSVANPPFFITGNGKPGDPWKLRTLSAEPAVDDAAPVVVALGDDPDGFFQSSPAAPIDIAVVLRNFPRLGADKAAVGIVLAWDEPDPMGLTALDNVLDRFDSLVMCAPLGRGAVPEPLPAAFRRASLPAAGIDGADSLPVVNRIPFPGVILGGSATAGFQNIDSEPTTGSIPLLARWDDRVVFAFPLLAAMQRLDVPPEKLEIRLGEYLRLGNEGPVLPIDSRGRFAVSSLQHPDPAVVRARDTIDREEALATDGHPVLFRDDRSAADDATRRFSALLAPALATLASRDGLSETTAYPRLRPNTEWTLLAIIAVAAFLACLRGGMSRGVLLAVLAAMIVAVQLLAFGLADRWLPGLPALAATAAAALVSLIPVRVVAKPPAPKPLPREPDPEPEAPPPEPKSKPSAKKAAKKAPAKKAARKTPARKSAPKKRGK
ncbi:MAG: hypothetical protein H7A50_07770 [Akkermansiaceae bacterium]|nr:hypothetical protein [Akkermansiaceae bacterium]